MRQPKRYSKMEPGYRYNFGDEMIFFAVTGLRSRTWGQIKAAMRRRATANTERRGKKIPDKEMMTKYADALGVSVAVAEVLASEQRRTLEQGSLKGWLT